MEKERVFSRLFVKFWTLVDLGASGQPSKFDHLGYVKFLIDYNYEPIAKIVCMLNPPYNKLKWDGESK